MKVLLKQFLGQNHSWAVTGQGIARALKKSNEVDLFSTDGIDNFPKDLQENLLGYYELNKKELHGKEPHKNYDCQISYTSMKNFGDYLSYGSKNRFGIWTSEWAGKNILPNGFAKHYKSCDKILAPSKFSKQIFIDSGVSEDSIEVVPHGVDESFLQNSKIQLPTKKTYKILANIAQNHKRKNLEGLLEAYGKAFTSKDDVCLILKAKDKAVTYQFEQSLSLCIRLFREKYKNHAELKIYSEFLPDISSLYRSVDTVITLSHGEGFYYPGLEAMISGKLSIAPNWGGQVDFLNNCNALLVYGKEERADPKSMYWESKYNAIWFRPSIDDAVDKMRYAKNNYVEINNRLESARQSNYERYSWDTIVKKIQDLCQQ